MISKRIRRLAWRALHRFAPPEMVVALKYRQTAISTHHTAFPPKNMVVAKDVSSGSVLILAPHPDDEIIGPGGTIALHLQNGDPVTVLYLTDGRGTISTDTSLIEVRRKEAKSVGNTYGLNQIFWDIPDTTLSDDPETVGKLTAVLDKIQPDYIYLPSFFDRQSDHFAANSLLANTLKQRKNLTAVILGYEVWDNISFPNYVVDISQTITKKTDMMGHYKTPMQATDFVTLFRHRNALHYSLFVSSAYQEREGYAEAFYRLEAKQYTILFDNYARMLMDNHSPLV